MVILHEKCLCHKIILNEIRIVLKHIGSPVKALHRISYGPIKLGNLKSEKILEIDKKTIDLILKNF